MQYETKKSKNRVTLFLKGVVGIRESQELKTKVFELSKESGSLLVIDLNQVDLMDSSGLGAIVYCHNKLKLENKKLCLISSNSKVDLLLVVTNAHKILDIYDDALGLVG